MATEHHVLELVKLYMQAIVSLSYFTSSKYRRCLDCVTESDRLSSQLSSKYELNDTHNFMIKF